MSNFQAPGDPTLSEAIGKRLMTPGGAVSPGVAPELFPTVVLENDRPELLHLTNSDRFCRSVSVAAGGVGTRSSAQLFVSVADLLVVVERIEVTLPSGNVQLRLNRLGPSLSPVGTPFVGVPNDSRYLGSSSAAVITDATLGAAGTSFYTGIGTSAILDRPFVLTQGNGLYVCATADNVAITSATFWWRERRLNQSERL